MSDEPLKIDFVLNSRSPAEAAASLEALSANREMERSTFLASSSEHS